MDEKKKIPTFVVIRGAAYPEKSGFNCHEVIVCAKDLRSMKSTYPTNMDVDRDIGSEITVGLADGTSYTVRDVWCFVEAKEEIQRIIAHNSQKVGQE
jgi:hypothetical protein